MIAAMSWIRTVPEGDAEEELLQLYELVADPENGQLDHIMQIHSLYPAGLRAHFELYRAVMRGTAGLRGADREMIALLVSHRNACRY